MRLPDFVFDLDVTHLHGDLHCRFGRDLPLFVLEHVTRRMGLDEREREREREREGELPLYLCCNFLKLLSEVNLVNLVPNSI